MIIFVTGQPGCGKSSLARGVIESLDKKVGGISTPDIRDGKRSGFWIMDLLSGKKDIMASVKGEGPKVSKYGVNVDVVRDIGVNAIKSALADPDVRLVLIDELGKMELLCPEFRDIVKEALGSGKDVLAVLHRDFLEEYQGLGRVFILDRENRDQVREGIMEMLGQTGP